MTRPPEPESAVIEERIAPDPLLKTLHALKDELVRLHFRWQLFKQLFVSGGKRVFLLNEQAQGFFYQIHFILLDDVLLAVARLLGPAQTGGQDNLTLGLLVQHVAETGDTALANALSMRLDKLNGDPFRKHRNKRIAHLDLKHHPKLLGEALPDLTPDFIDKTLDEVGAILNEVEFPFEDGNTAYGAVSSLSDGDTLMFALQKAANWDKLLKAGVISIDELQKDEFQDT